MTNVVFYNKDGKEFSDAVTVVSGRYNSDEVLSKNAEHDAYAKKEIDGDRIDCFVKKCTTGNNAGHFADPFGGLYTVNLSAIDVYAGRRYYEYERVKGEVFNLYISFLKTRNPSYLRNAERSFLGG